MTIEELKQNIAASESRSGELRRQLVANDAATMEMRRELARLEYGVEPGAVVVVGKKRHRVVEVLPHSWSGKPWLKVNLELGDGTFGTGVRRLCGDWELEEPLISSALADGGKEG